jgi:hypothetical protein
MRTTSRTPRSGPVTMQQHGCLPHLMARVTS